MSDDQRKEAVLEYGQKPDDTVGEKFRSAKGWFFKIFGGVFILFGLFFAFKGIKSGDTV